MSYPQLSRFIETGLPAQIQCYSQVRDWFETLLRLPARHVARDVIFIGLISLALGLLHFGLPSPIRDTILARPAHSDLLTAYLSAYLHLSTRHLLANIGLFTVVSLVLYGVAARIDQEQWWYLTSVLMLVGGPILMSMFFHRVLQLLFPALEVTAVGFSGIISGLLGALLLAFMLSLRTAFSLSTVSLLGFFVAMNMIFYTLWAHSVSLTVVEFFGALALLIFPIADLSRRAIQSRDRILRLPDEIIVLRMGYIAGFLLFFAVVFRALIPKQPIGDEALTVLFHLVGFLIGGALAVFALLLMDSLPIRDHIRKRGHDPNTVIG